MIVLAGPQSDLFSGEINILIELLEQMGKKPFMSSRDGMGLGLFLSHTIIERIGGKISFSNRKPHGLSTKISFPINF